jgi:protocatechuate 3,4-dioxygenase beta subunit
MRAASSPIERHSRVGERPATLTRMRIPLAAAALTAPALFAAAAYAQERGSVRGRLYGPLGEPLVNVEVVAVREPRGGEVVARARTDGDGRWLLQRVPTTSMLTLLARVPERTVAAGFAFGAPDAGDDAVVTLRCWEAVTLRGRVVDADGAPVRGATVLGTRDATWFAGTFLPPEVRTGDDGTFELRGVPIGRAVVRVHAPGFELAEVVHPTLVDAEVSVPPLVRGDGRVVRAQVTGLPEGAGGVELRVSAAEELPSPLQALSIGADGRGELRGLPRRDLSAYVRSAPVALAPARLQLPANGPELATMRTVPADATQLTGRVIDGAGAPLAGVAVRVRAQRTGSMSADATASTRTGADGRFVLPAPLLAGERFSLALLDPNWALAQQKVQPHWGVHDPRYLSLWEGVADETPLELVAQRAACARCRLVDGEGRPVAFQRVQLLARRDRGLPEWAPLAVANSDGGGEVEFRGLRAPDGDVRLTSEGPGGAGTGEPFALEPGATTRADLVVHRPGTVRGRVLDAQGRGVPGITVTLTNCDAATGKQTDGAWVNVSTDRSGRFVFVDVPPGGHRVQLELRGAGERFPTAPFEVAPGGTSEVDVRVR